MYLDRARAGKILDHMASDVQDFHKSDQQCNWLVLWDHQNHNSYQPYIAHILSLHFQNRFRLSKALDSLDLSIVIQQYMALANLFRNQYTR